MMLAPPFGKNGPDAQAEVEEVTDVVGIARKELSLQGLSDTMGATSRSWQARPQTDVIYRALGRGTNPHHSSLRYHTLLYMLTYLQLSLICPPYCC